MPPIYASSSAKSCTNRARSRIPSALICDSLKREPFALSADDVGLLFAHIAIFHQMLIVGGGGRVGVGVVADVLRIRTTERRKKYIQAPDQPPLAATILVVMIGIMIMIMIGIILMI